MMETVRLIWSQPAFRLFAGLSAPLLWMALLDISLERFWPRAERRRERGAVNLSIWGTQIAAQEIAGPVLAGMTTWMLGSSGHGLIVLPTHGWGWAAGLAAYFLAMDLGEYLFHRAQHAIPWMWAMHALHHSDRHYDASTTMRHFWLEPAIKMATIWLAVGLLFKTPASVITVYVAVSYWHYVVHSNSRLDFGRWSWVLNGPAYHRLHHSRLPEHFDTNFAALFPIFDVLSRSYRRARPGEVIPTGLDTGEAPETPWEALIWPWRNLLSRIKPAPLAAPASQTGSRATRRPCVRDRLVGG